MKQRPPIPGLYVVRTYSGVTAQKSLWSLESRCFETDEFGRASAENWLWYLQSESPNEHFFLVEVTC